MRDTLAVSTSYVLRILRSPRFFYVIVAVLAVQAAWIALTARYPQAFDENFHFGLIQLHAQQWLPFFTSQHDGPALYGAAVRDPSYLFHYLFSLPYRLLVSLGVSETTQIIVLRFLNIGLFVGGLFVYRRLFNELKITRGIRNIVLLVFVLLPVVPLLAGQINYDNLLFLLTGLLFLYITRYVQHLRGRRLSEPLVPLATVLGIVLIGALGSLVKFAFVPIYMAALMAVIGLAVVYYNRARYRPAVFAVARSIRERVVLFILAVCVAAAVGLCFERYGVNLVQYHSPVPKCDKVLSVDACQAYSPWARDYLFASIYSRPTLQGYLVYPFVWINRMVFETLFTITSYFNDEGTVTYSAHAPLRIAHVAGWIGLGIGAIGALVSWRRIRYNRPLAILLLITVFYAIVLFIQNLAMYHHSGEAVAIHGRYLVPVFPILLLCLAFGWQELLARIRDARYSAAVLVVLVLLFLQGGGITNWLVRSDPSWYWQQHAPAAQANATVKAVLSKVIYHPKY